MMQVQIIPDAFSMPLRIRRLPVRIGQGVLVIVGDCLGAGQSPTNFEGKAHQMTNLVTWLAAPDWLTPSEAAALLGPSEDVTSILGLMQIGAVDWEEIDGRLLIEKRSLREYHDALWEVLTDEQ